MPFNKLLVFILLLAPLGASAQEGLFPSNPEAKLLKSWNGTVLILHKSGFTSGFLIQRENIRGKEYYFFLTAGHSLHSLGIHCNESPNIPSVNRNVQVYQDVHLYFDSNSPTGYRITQGTKYPMVLSWAACELGLGVDTGIIVFAADRIFSDLPSLNFSNDPDKSKIGARNFALGFPVVTMRPLEYQNLPLELPLTVTKRWSTGLLTGLVEGDQKYFGTTADSLPGNSGGPIVDDNGDVIGMEVANNFCYPSCSYDGVEEVGSLKPWTFYYPKENLVRFSTSRIQEIKDLIIGNPH